MHVVDAHSDWDKGAAEKAIRLFSRRRDGAGQPLEADPLQMAARIVAQVQKRSAEVVLETAFNEDRMEGASNVQHLARPPSSIILKLLG